MSRREWKFLLDDILEAIGKVQNYVAGSSFEGFEDDSKTIDAVVRNFIIVGEAAVIFRLLLLRNIRMFHGV